MSFGEAAKIRDRTDGPGRCSESLGAVADTRVLTTIISLSSEHWGPAPTSLSSIIRRKGSENLRAAANLYKPWGVCVIGILMRLANDLADAKMVFQAIPNKHFEGQVSKLLPPAYLAVHLVTSQTDEVIAQRLMSLISENNANLQSDMDGERPRKYMKMSPDARRSAAAKFLSQLNANVVTNAYQLACGVAANENDPAIGDRYTPEEMRLDTEAKMDEMRLFNAEDPVHHTTLFNFRTKVTSLLPDEIAINQTQFESYEMNGARVIPMPEYTAEDNVNFIGYHRKHACNIWINNRVRDEQVNSIFEESFPWIHSGASSIRIQRNFPTFHHADTEEMTRFAPSPYHLMQTTWQDTGVSDMLDDYAPAITQKLSVYNVPDGRDGKAEFVTKEANRIVAIALGSFSSRQTGIPCSMSSILNKMFKDMRTHDDYRESMRVEHGADWRTRDDARKLYPASWIMYHQRCTYNADPLSSALMEFGEILSAHGYGTHVGVLLTLFSLAAMSGNTRLTDRIAVALDGPAGKGKTRLLMKLRRMMMEYKIMSAETEKSLTCASTDNERSDIIPCFSDEGFESMRVDNPDKPHKVTAASRLWQQVLSDGRINYELIGRSEHDPISNTYRREKETFAGIIRWFIFIAVNDFEKTTSRALVDRFITVKMSHSDSLQAKMLRGQALMEPLFQNVNGRIIERQESMFRFLHGATYLINLLSATGFLPALPDVSNLLLVMELLSPLPAVKFLGFDDDMPVRVIVKMRNRMHAEVIMRIVVLVYYYGVLGTNFSMGDLVEFAYSQFFVTTEMAVTNYIMGIFTINYDKDNTRVYADIKDNELRIDEHGQSMTKQISGTWRTGPRVFTLNYPMVDNRDNFIIRRPTGGGIGARGSKYPIRYNEVGTRVDFGKDNATDKINMAFDQLKRRKTPEGMPSIPTSRGQNEELLVHTDSLKNVIGPREKLMLRVLGEVCRENVELADQCNMCAFQDIDNVRYINVPDDIMRFFDIPHDNVPPKVANEETAEADKWFAEKIRALSNPPADAKLLRYAHDRNNAMWHLLRNTVLMNNLDDSNSHAILKYTREVFTQESTSIGMDENGEREIITEEVAQTDWKGEPIMYTTQVLVQQRALQIPYEDYINTVTQSILDEASYAIKDSVIAHSPCGAARVVKPHVDNKQVNISNPLYKTTPNFEDASATLFSTKDKTFYWDSRESTNDIISSKLHARYCNNKWRQPQHYTPREISRRLRDSGDKRNLTSQA